jgi:hypothetical protein
MTIDPALYGFSLLAAGIIALVRFKSISPFYTPFIICVWIGCVNEILCYVLVQNDLRTAINNNIYVLSEALLFLLFFRNTGIFKKRTGLYRALFAGIILLWVWENGIAGKITGISSWFRIAASLLIVLMGMTVMHKIITGADGPVEMEGRHLYRNPVFLVCLGSVVFFTYKLLVEIFWLQGLNNSPVFRQHIYGILVYVNLIVNIVYAISLLWTLQKQKYMRVY